MPNVHFKCECGNEFDKIVQGKKELHKWCKHCDALTVWIEIRDEHSTYYREKVCSRCYGNEHKAPEPTMSDSQTPEGFQVECPKCGATAKQLLEFHAYSGKPGEGQNVATSSLRFHFNYLPLDN